MCKSLHIQGILTISSLKDILYSLITMREIRYKNILINSHNNAKAQPL